MASLSRVVEQIFGTNVLQSTDRQDLDSGNYESVFRSINNQLLSFHHYGESSRPQVLKSSKKIKVDHGDGRIGNAKVSLDLLGLSNRVSLFESFKIIGVSHFGTVKTNCGVYRGKWQYEVLLLSTGVMQLGWATFNSKFGPGQGVGDTADSYAVDGNRVRKWNILAEDYGEKWEEDDVIGCCIDLDEGCVEFFRNGRSMGVAFKKIRTGAGIAYFPAISLQQKEGVIANFGSTPFYYPVPEYHPIQEPPHEDLASMTYLLDCVNKLLALMDSRTISPDSDVVSSVLSHEAVLLEVGKVLLCNVTPFLSNPYLIETKLLPFIRGLCELENVNQGHVRPSARVAIPKSTTTCTYKSRKMNIFLDMVWAFTEKNELKAWTSNLVSRLSSRFQHNIRPFTLEFFHQKDAVLVLHCLLNHRKLRHFLMNHILFEGVKFPWFTNIKVSSNESNSFWETDSSIEINQRAYNASVNRISSAMNSLEEMQVEMILTMLDNSDGSSTEPTSRKIFLDKFRVLRRQFYALYLVDPHKSPGSPFFLVWPFFLRLLRVMEILWRREIGSSTPDVVPSTKFYDGSISYFDIDRLGGVLLYLLKTFLNDVEQRLGVAQQTQVSEVYSNTGTQAIVDSSTSTVRNIRGPMGLTNLSERIFDVFEDNVHIDAFTDQLEQVPINTDDNAQPIEQPLDTPNFLSEILDSLILFYHLSNKTNSLTHRINLHQNKVKELIQSLSEIKDAMRCYHMSSKHECDALKAMQISHTVLLDHLHKATSSLTTLHAMRYPNRHSWLFKVVLNTLQTSAEDLHLFNFVPEFYLDCLVDIMKELSLEAKPTFVPLEEIPDSKQLMHGVVQFICDHIDDQRIRIAKAKDALLIALLDIVTTPTLVEVLHSIPADSRMNMIRFLLQPYENRAWANSNWVLVRIWHGSPNSFACSGQWTTYHKYKLKSRPLSYPIGPLSLDCDPNPSFVLQEQIQTFLVNKPENATSFLNSVLNQLNWAFSEFIGMLQELQNASNRQERVLVESRQLQICATCFDLTLALLRVLEMVAVLALSVFVSPDQPNSYFMLARLCQLLCQVLNRTSSQDGCFHHIATLEIPGLENVDHFPILAAVCGILLAILKEDIDNFQDIAVPKVTKILLMEPSFQLSSFTFLLEENSNYYSLHYYKEFMRSEEITMVHNMLTMLTHYHRVNADSNAASNAVDEDEMCTICFAFPISTVFEPCKHHSCRACITHHLMNCSNCFFCKAVITKVTDDEGKVIFNNEQGPVPGSSSN